jgi:hypothetical protein
VDGNYTSTLGDLVLKRADTLVWLDPPLPLVLWRVWRRTIGRIASRAELWGGNRETWRNAFFTRDSLFVWALHTHGRFRRRLPARLASEDCAHVRLIHLRGPRQVRRLLEGPESEEGLVECRSSSGCDDRSEARTQGASMLFSSGATEAAASGEQRGPTAQRCVSPSPPT